MNINQLKDAFDVAGQKVQDLEDKRAQIVIDLGKDESSHSVDEVTKLNESLKNAKMNQELAKSAYEDARTNLKAQQIVQKPLKVGKNDSKSNFANGFRDMLKHPMKYLDTLTSSDSDEASAGLTIPDDQQTQINTLMRQYDDLRDLVTVENVATDHGTRNVEKFSEIKPMDQMDDIKDDSSQTDSNYGWQDKDMSEGDYGSARKISYQIHDYGDIFYAPNDLIQDSDANILAWLNDHIARKQVVTYNDKILKLLPNSQKKATITKLDDIIDTLGKLNMALWSGATLVTNKSGLMELAKVRMSDGSRAMKTDPRTLQSVFNMDGMQYFNVRVIEDTWLPNNTTAQGKYQSHPFYLGNFKEFIHLYDRQQASLLTSNTADKAFKRNQTAIRAMVRFDTKIWDDEAIVSGSFDKIASQPALFQSVTVQSKPSEQENN